MAEKTKISSVCAYDAFQMHQYNRRLIFNLFRGKEVLSRAELTHITGMSPTSIGKIIAALEEDGLLLKTGLEEEGLGRKAVLYRINPGGRYVIGADIDRHVIRMGLVDLCGQLQKKAVWEEAPTEDVYKTGKIISELSTQLIEALAPDDRKKVSGIGISVPGIVEYPDGKIEVSPQLGWEKTDLKKEIELKHNIPIFIENDVKAEAMVEILFGMGREYKDMYIVKLGIGIGSALVLDNRVVRGSNNILGEIGHLLLVPGGKKCECGRMGCIEAYCGKLCMEQELGMPFEEIRNRAMAGEKKCAELLEQSLMYLSLLLSNTVNIYNQPILILYGELLEEWPELFELLIERQREYLWKPESMARKIVRSRFEGAEVGILGAAAVVLNECCYHIS